MLRTWCDAISCNFYFHSSVHFAVCVWEYENMTKRWNLPGGLRELWMKMHILNLKNKITVFIIMCACKTARTHLIWFMYMNAYISKWFVKHFSEYTSSFLLVIPYALFSFFLPFIHFGLCRQQFYTFYTCCYISNSS